MTHDCKKKTRSKLSGFEGFSYKIDTPKFFNISPFAKIRSIEFQTQPSEETTFAEKLANDTILRTH